MKWLIPLSSEKSWGFDGGSGCKDRNLGSDSRVIKELASTELWDGGRKKGESFDFHNFYR